VIKGLNGQSIGKGGEPGDVSQRDRVTNPKTPRKRAKKGGTEKKVKKVETLPSGRTVHRGFQLLEEGSH